MTEEQFDVGGLSNPQAKSMMAEGEMYVYGVYTNIARELLNGAVKGGHISPEGAEEWVDKFKAQENSGGVNRVLQELVETHPTLSQEVLGRPYGKVISESTKGSSLFTGQGMQLGEYIPESQPSSLSPQARYAEVQGSLKEHPEWLEALSQGGVTSDGEAPHPTAPTATPGMNKVEMSDADREALIKLLNQRLSRSSPEHGGMGIG